MVIQQVKPAIMHRTPVTYDGIAYTVTAVIARTNGDKWHHQLELLDKNGNSIVIVPMDKVEIMGEITNDKLRKDYQQWPRSTS